MEPSAQENTGAFASKGAASEEDPNTSEFRLVRFERHDTTTVGTILATSFTSAKQVDQFRGELTGYFRKNPGVHLLLDFHRVRHLTVGALAQLLVVRRVAQGVGGKITLCSLQRNVRCLFEITNFDKEFHIYTSLF